MLVNNAGIFLDYESDQEADRKVLLEQLNTNVVSVAVVIQACSSYFPFYHFQRNSSLF